MPASGAAWQPCTDHVARSSLLHILSRFLSMKNCPGHVPTSSSGPIQPLHGRLLLAFQLGHGASARGDVQHAGFARGAARRAVMLHLMHVCFFTR